MTTKTQTATPPARASRPRTSATNEGVTDLFASRFRRLKPREARILILVVQDRLGHRQIAEALGISRTNVTSSMRSVRRKLAVPSHMHLQRFIETVPSLAALVKDDSPVIVATTTKNERRQQDLLRVVIDELQAVALRARRRAATLETIPGCSEESDSPKHEARMARRVAQIIDAASEEVLREVRKKVLPRSDEAFGIRRGR